MFGAVQQKWVESLSNKGTGLQSGITADGHIIAVVIHHAIIPPMTTLLTAAATAATIIIMLMIMVMTTAAVTRRLSEEGTHGMAMESLS